MKLNELKNYYSFRLNQIAWLERAIAADKYGEVAQAQVFLYLLHWSQSMHSADEMLKRRDFASAAMQARGFL